MGRRGKPSPASSPLRGLPSPLLLGALPLKPQNMPFYDVCEVNSVTTSDCNRNEACLHGRRYSKSQAPTLLRPPWGGEQAVFRWALILKVFKYFLCSSEMRKLSQAF